jgi:coenzyme F420-0:L-glutamate ligase/coenzyme F420-1:gamma-L-glutamate ligase
LPADDPSWQIGTPVVLVRGLTWKAPANPASELVRPATEDLFR